MPQCSNCAGHVSERYRRVFSDNSGDLHACPECTNQAEQLRGAGVGR